MGCFHNSFQKLFLSKIEKYMYNKRNFILAGILIEWQDLSLVGSDFWPTVYTIKVCRSLLRTVRSNRRRSRFSRRKSSSQLDDRWWLEYNNEILFGNEGNQRLGWNCTRRGGAFRSLARASRHKRVHRPGRRFVLIEVWAPTGDLINYNRRRSTLAWIVLLRWFYN